MIASGVKQVIIWMAGIFVNNNKSIIVYNIRLKRILVLDASRDTILMHQQVQLVINQLLDVKFTPVILCVINVILDT